MMLSVIIVNWNTASLLKRCLISLRTELPADSEVIVVDNGSRDGSAAVVRNEFPDVHLIANRRNLGFAAANNQAFAQSRNKTILLLNTDVTFTHGSLRRLVAFLHEHADAAGAAPKLLNPDQSTQYFYHRRHLTFGRLIASTLHTYGVWPNNRIARDYLLLNQQFNVTAPIEHPAAACLLLRRTAIIAAGGLFDERFPIFLNDVDLSERFARAGQTLWLVANANAIHDKSQSTDRLDPYLNRELYFRSILGFFRKHRRLSAYVAAKMTLLVTLPSLCLLTALGLTRRYFLAPITDRRASIRKQLRVIASVAFEGELPNLPT